MAEGTVQIAPFTNMPDDVAKMASETAEAIKTGKLHPFTGPITKQDGTVVGEAGKPLPDGSPGPSLYAAIIVKKVDAQTRSKTGINELLRD